MKREIKFRAWNPAVGMLDAIRLEAAHGIRLVSSSDLAPHFASDADWVFMQSTGLKDKKGTEIYEGDIVRHRKIRGDETSIFGLQEFIRQDDPIKVEWNNCGFDPLSGWIESAIEQLQFEVIGDIYSNRELLTNRSSV